MAHKTKAERRFNLYTLTFTYSSAAATVIVEKKGQFVLHVESRSREFRDLQYWMAQEPEAARFLNLDECDRYERVEQSMSALGFAYSQAAENICLLESDKKITEYNIESHLERIARFLHARFALKEKIRE